MIRGIRRFKMSYQAYPLAELPGKKRPDVIKGGKMIMPPSALGQLSGLDITYPMLFRLTNPENDKVSHCGVLEFIADEDKVYLPQWMISTLDVIEGEDVIIENVELPVGTFSKFQALSTDFLDITNPKAVLESCLRSYACLTMGDVIAITYNNKIYELSVLETLPDEAINIIECDMSVEFAPPIGYVEAQPPTVTDRIIDPADLMPSTSIFVPFQGEGHRLDGKKRKLSSEPEAPAAKAKYVRGIPDDSYKVGNLTFIRQNFNKLRSKVNDNRSNEKFQPFSGTGHVLQDKSGAGNALQVEREAENALLDNNATGKVEESEAADVLQGNSVSKTIVVDQDESGAENDLKKDSGTKNVLQNEDDNSE